jgi:hypothetical protein
VGGSFWRRCIAPSAHRAVMPGKSRPNRNGGRHCCQPPLRRAKDLPVFASLGFPREGSTRFSILAHQLRRRFSPNRSLVRGARPIYSTAQPEGSLVFRSFRPSSSGTEVPSKSRVAREAIPSSGASSRLAPARARKLFPIACRRRSDPWSPAAPSCRCRLSGEAGTAVPIT